MAAAVVMTARQVTCDWLTADVVEVARFPKTARAHQGHADDVSLCDAWVCRCGNTPGAQGFLPCDAEGREVQPTGAPSRWYVCDGCGAVIDPGTGQKVGQRAEAPK